jgi:anaerobic magnesium-protoporphyrin IX monomethyl ester cyclase
MRITLVSAHTHPFALGLRGLSSYLKAAGHDVEMLFMSSRRDTTRPDYAPGVLDDFIARLRDRDLIGMSLLTNNFHRACFLTDHIRQAGIAAPIVWGGTHPTMAPDESLGQADAICIGEGEHPLLQLTERLERGQDPTGVPSLWFRGGGRLSGSTVRNSLAPLPTDLDALPFADYELDTHWVAGPEHLEPAQPRNLRGALDTLRILTTRGCPYHCTFCNNTALRRVHDGAGRWVRTRSLENVLDELRLALRCYPSIRAINFVDDLFFVRRAEEIERFAEAYVRDINVPLELDAFPNTVTARKVAALAKVPIQLISMGIESASTNTLEEIYQRPTTKRRIAEAIDTFADQRVRTEYHYIVSNPFEPEENVVETMRFIADHHRGPSVLRVFPLMFYPGTPLYERARREGVIDTQDRAAYDFMGTGALQFAKHDYLAVWLRCVLNLRNLGAPRWLAHRVIDFSTSRVTRKLLDHNWFCPTER